MHRRRTRAITGLPVWALTLTLILMAGQADPLAWALPNADLAVVIRDGDLPARAIDAVEARFSGHRHTQAAVAEARALTIAGARPLARRWGAGVELGHGLAFYAEAAGEGLHERLVIGAGEGGFEPTLIRWVQAQPLRRGLHGRLRGGLNTMLSVLVDEVGIWVAPTSRRVKGGLWLRFL